MKVTDIETPDVPSNYDFSQGILIAPFDRVRIMSDTDFEIFISEWAVGYLKSIYD